MPAGSMCYCKIEKFIFIIFDRCLEQQGQLIKYIQLLKNFKSYGIGRQINFHPQVEIIKIINLKSKTVFHCN